MLLTTRVSTLQTGVEEAIGLALEAHAIVTKATDLELGVYLGGAGYAPNTFFFSALVENMAMISTQTQKLLSSKKYTAFTEKVAPLMADPGESRLRAVVAMAPAEPAEIPVGAVGSVFTATMNAPRLVDAMAFGADITNYYHNATDTPVAFLRNIAGNVVQLTWIGVQDSAAGVDKLLEWEATDVGYQERYAAAGDLFVTGSAHRGFITRLI
jgi:hypothetical protein